MSLHENVSVSNLKLFSEKISPTSIFEIPSMVPFSWNPEKNSKLLLKEPSINQTSAETTSSYQTESFLDEEPLASKPVKFSAKITSKFLLFPPDDVSLYCFVFWSRTKGETVITNTRTFNFKLEALVLFPSPNPITSIVLESTLFPWGMDVFIWPDVVCSNNGFMYYFFFYTYRGIAGRCRLQYCILTEWQKIGYYAGWEYFVSMKRT